MHIKISIDMNLIECNSLSEMLTDIFQSIYM